MRAELFWIPARLPGRIAIMPRPRGGDWLEDEVQSWRSEGIDVVVSLLTTAEVVDLDLADEERLCKASGIDFRAFPIPDRAIPAARAGFLDLATALASDLAMGKNIAIHCRQGIGRAPLLALGVLVLAGLDLETATTMVSQARGCPVPETVEQQRWIAEFAKGIPIAVRK